MGLQSMTGFARATGEYESAVISWELRSVNGKGMEIRLRLPSGQERFEQMARQAVQRRFARGTFQATLAISSGGKMLQPLVNEAFLLELTELAGRLEKQYGCAPARADGLLALKGVLEMPEGMVGEEQRAQFDAYLLSVLETALGSLEESRRAEGSVLGTMLIGHLDTIETLVRRVEADPSRDPTFIRARLAEQVRLLTDASPGLDEARLHQEAAFLATKADIREEIDRLTAHIGSARKLLSEGGAIGRRLDFLAQEFNRESNTLCSKSNAGSVTAIGLELKAVIDQFREQVQNLE